MIDADIIFAKIGNIRSCLQRIQDVTNYDPKSLEDINKQDIFVLNLQRAIQSAIDLATHLVASEGLGLSSTLKDNFLLLQKAGILPADLADRMMKMVGFRNIAIHDYQILNIAILKKILSHNLKDLEDFAIHLLEYYKL